MRPKVVAAVLLAAVALLGIAALVSTALRPRSPEPASAPAAGSSPGEEQNNSSLHPSARGADWSAPVALPISSVFTNNGPTNPVPDDLAHARYVRQRIAELESLAMNNDVASRDAILAELQNPDKEIRHAALEATIQYGDRSVIPRLQEMAEQTEDPSEKAEVLEAVDYLKLPSLTEYLAERKAQAATGGQTNLSPPSTNRLGRPSHKRLLQPATSSSGN